MFAIGFALGPMTHVWYGYLDRLFPGKTRGHIVRKILLDQMFGAPTFSFTFIVGKSMWEVGGRKDNGPTRIQQDKIDADYIFLFKSAEELCLFAMSVFPAKNAAKTALLWWLINRMPPRKAPPIYLVDLD